MKLVDCLARLDSLLQLHGKKSTVLRVRPHTAGTAMVPFCRAYPPQKLLVEDPVSHYSRLVRAERVFGPSASNYDLAMSLDYLSYSVTKGEDAVVLSSGISGSGKSHTLFGEANDGIAFIMMDHIIQFSRLLPGEKNFSIKMVELTDRGVYLDLLTDYEKVQVPSDWSTIDHLTEIPVDSANLVSEWVSQGFTFLSKSVSTEEAGVPSCPSSSVVLFFIAETVIDDKHFKSSLTFVDTMDLSLLSNLTNTAFYQQFVRPPPEETVTETPVAAATPETTTTPVPEAVAPVEEEKIPDIPLDSVLSAVFNPLANSCYVFTLSPELELAPKTLQALSVAGQHCRMQEWPLPRPAEQTAARLVEDTQLLSMSCSKHLADFAALKSALDDVVKTEVRLRRAEATDKAMELKSQTKLIPMTKARMKCSLANVETNELKNIGRGQTKVMLLRLKRLQSALEESMRMSMNFAHYNQEVEVLLSELRGYSDEFDLKRSMASQYVKHFNLKTVLPTVSSKLMENVEQHRLDREKRAQRKSLSAVSSPTSRRVSTLSYLNDEANSPRPVQATPKKSKTTRKSRLSTPGKKKKAAHSKSVKKTTTRSKSTKKVVTRRA